MSKEAVLAAVTLVGGKRAWVCVSAGTPGTWKPWGAIDA